MLAKFIHPAKVCLFCTILVIFLFCLLNFFVNRRCLTFFLLMLICGFLEWMHVWKFVSNAVLIGFEMNIYEHEHILQSCLTVVYLSIYFVEVAVIQSTFDFAQVEANFWLQSVQFCSEEETVPLFFQHNNIFHCVVRSFHSDFHTSVIWWLFKLSPRQVGWHGLGLIGNVLLTF